MKPPSGSWELFRLIHITTAQHRSPCLQHAWEVEHVTEWTRKPIPADDFRNSIVCSRSCNLLTPDKCGSSIARLKGGTSSTCIELKPIQQIRFKWWKYVLQRYGIQKKYLTEIVKRIVSLDGDVIMIFSTTNHHIVRKYFAMLLYLEVFQSFETRLILPDK